MKRLHQVYIFGLGLALGALVLTGKGANEALRLGMDPSLMHRATAGAAVPSFVPHADGRRLVVRTLGELADLAGV